MSAGSVTVIALSPAELRTLIREELQREREAQRPPKLSAEELGELLGKKPGALRSFLCRHPDFPREHAGQRLLFDRAKVDEWLAEHRAQGAR